MSFYDELKEIEKINIKEVFNNVTDIQILRAIEKDFITEEDFLALISPRAEVFLEAIAQKSNKLTRQYFGKAIQMFTPLYISNYCENDCTYCGYRANSGMTRRQLSLYEIDKESKAIHETGMRQVLLLTGDSKKASTSYIIDAATILKKYFPMIGIEIKALNDAEYRMLNKAGVNYLTIYQETYDEENYKKYHKKGPKSDFKFRLGASERGAEANFTGINIGFLMGLSDTKRDAYYLAMHAKYLRKYYPDVELAISLPRLRPTKGGYEYEYIVEDKEYVQILMALRLFLPRVGITLSTRENDDFRGNLLPLGITKVSAGVKTSVGGYSEEKGSTEQFEISDDRSVKEVHEYLLEKGFQPVFKDWDIL